MPGVVKKGVLEADGVRQVRQLLRDKGPFSVNPTSRIEKRSGVALIQNLFRPSLSVTERA